MYDTTCETIENEAGTLRARIVHDPAGGDFKPDGCWFGTVYIGEAGRFSMEGHDGCARGTEVNLDSLWTGLRDWDDIESVLRGKTTRCYHCNILMQWVEVGDDSDDFDGWQAVHNSYPADQDWRCPEGEHEVEWDYRDEEIVGFDVRHTGHGTTHVNLVTEWDLRHWGFENAADFTAKHPDKDPSDGNLKEWIAWAEGDVYYVVIERKLHTTTTVSTLDGEWIRDEWDEPWEEIDSLHGLYTEEYAEQVGREMLADAEPAVAA